MPGLFGKKPNMTSENRKYSSRSFEKSIMEGLKVSKHD